MEDLPSLSDIYPDRKKGETISCEILDHSSEDGKWTTFKLFDGLHGEGGTMLKFVDKMHKILDGLECECPDREEYARLVEEDPYSRIVSYICPFDSIVNRVIQIEWDGCNWEVVPVNENDRSIY